MHLTFIHAPFHFLFNMQKILRNGNPLYTDSLSTKKPAQGRFRFGYAISLKI